ncbi:hypothetical protein V8B97DRAFT_1966901 [Scleroderma yunnanense]
MHACMMFWYSRIPCLVVMISVVCGLGAMLKDQVCLHFAVTPFQFHFSSISNTSTEEAFLTSSRQGTISISLVFGR